jgi:hypothetical protein
MRFDMQSASEDRILYWPFAIAIACPLAFVLAWANLFMGSLLFVPVVLLIWAGMAVCAAITCVTCLQQRTWRRFISTLILPLTVLFATVNLGFVWRAGHILGDYVHLSALYPRYMAEVSELTGDAPRFLVWVWIGTAPCSTGVAYDDSDGLEPDGLAKVWGGRGGLSVHSEFRAFGHFYFVDICPQPDRDLRTVY